jgi:hypothetical protein
VLAAGNFVNWWRYSRLDFIGRLEENLPDPSPWQKAHELVLSVYRLTAAFPKEEVFCLTHRCGEPLCPYRQISQKVLKSAAARISSVLLMLLKAHWKSSAII